MRIYNPSLGRFLSVDPLSYKFPYYSPYHFAGNSPLMNLDLDGAEDLSYIFKQEKNGKYTQVAVTDYRQTKEGSGSQGHGVQCIFINKKGEIRKEFYSGHLINPERPIENFLIGLDAKVRGNWKVGTELEGKEHSPVKKAELGSKISLRTGPLKAQYKVFINDEGNERGVDYVQKGSVSTSIANTDKDIDVSAIPLYLNFTLNNEAGNQPSDVPKLNIVVPINGFFSLVITANSKGISNIEVNLGGTKKVGVEQSTEIAEETTPVNTDPNRGKIKR